MEPWTVCSAVATGSDQDVCCQGILALALLSGPGWGSGLLWAPVPFNRALICPHFLLQRDRAQGCVAQVMWD